MESHIFQEVGEILTNSKHTILVLTMKTFFQKGIGLIEVLIAGIVFAVGIIAVVQLQGDFLGIVVLQTLVQ